MGRKTFKLFMITVFPMFATHKFNSGVKISWSNGKSYKKKNKQKNQFAINTNKTGICTFSLLIRRPSILIQFSDGRASRKYVRTQSRVHPLP